MTLLWFVIVGVGYLAIQTVFYPQLPPDANLFQSAEAGIWAIYFAIVTAVPVIVISMGVAALPPPVLKGKLTTQGYPPRTSPPPVPAQRPPSPQQPSI